MRRRGRARSTRGRRRRRTSLVRGTSTGSVLADSAPILRASDRELVHVSDEVIPLDLGTLGSEKRVSDRRRDVRRGSVVPQEADRDVVCAWDRGGRGNCGVGHELKGHGRGVVGYAVEHWVDVLQAGKTEEGGETAIGAELDAELALAGAGDGGVEELDDLGGEGHACYCACVIAAVVGEAPFMGVGESAELEKHIIGY